MNDREELIQPFLKPTEYKIDDVINSIRSFNTEVPYLGLADEAFKPSDDPDYDQRLKRAAKVNAWGDVLSSIFDTAVSASGGMVDKSGQNQYQLKNLEDYNHERMRAFQDRQQLQAAKLRGIIENARQQFEAGQLQNKLVADAQLRKTDQEFQSQENARKSKEEAYYRDQEQQKRFAHEQKLQDKRSAADKYQSDMMYNRYRDYPTGSRTQNVGLSLTDSAGKNYDIPNAKVHQLYTHILNNLDNLGEGYEELANTVAFNERFDKSKITMDYKKQLISSLFEHPSISEEFIRLANRGDGTPAGNMVMQNTEPAAASTAPKQQSPQDLLAPISGKAKAILEGKGNKKAKREAIAKLVIQQYPDLDKAAKVEIANMLLKNLK